MTKQDVKTLCEHDPQLQWWAMVLFAEVCEMMDSVEIHCDRTPMPGDHKMLYDYVKTKAAEFPRLVVQESLNKAKAAEKAAREKDGGVE